MVVLRSAKNEEEHIVNIKCELSGDKINVRPIGPVDWTELMKNRPKKPTDL